MEPTGYDMAVAAFKAALALVAAFFWLYAINRWLWAAVITLVALAVFVFVSLWAMFLGV
jgi:hypothetical protein